MANPNYEEGVVCLYKGTEAKNFSADEVKDALADGWKDAPSTEAPKRRGRPPKEE